MKRKCTNCSTQIRSHVLVIEERDFCSKLCRCKNIHGAKNKEGKPKKSSCGVCTPAVEKQPRKPQATRKARHAGRKGRAVLVV